RLLLDFLATGIDIDGVEISPDMLAILRTRAEAAGIHIAGPVHQAAMQSMVLPRQYRVILVPSSSFQLLIDPADAASAMWRFPDRLEPGGTLVMPWIDIVRDYPGGAHDEGTREVTLEDGSVIWLTSHGWFQQGTRAETTARRLEQALER